MSPKKKLTSLDAPCTAILPGMPPGLLHAYADGGTFRTNPGPMTWAVAFIRDGTIVQHQGKDFVLVGAREQGTNVRAELMAAIWALERAPREDLVICTDSLVTIRCGTGEYRRHVNLDLWAQFDLAWNVRERWGCRTDFQYVRGHHTDPFNQYVDRLARTHALQNFSLVAVANQVCDDALGTERSQET